ncbi:MAG: c-type cytochrome, partial [Gammaproteobacteria bacterium]|nr:c-type cytochrome [Gammaproteobacteria bacterium]
MAAFRSHTQPDRPVSVSVLAVASVWLALVPAPASAQALTPTVPVSAEDLERGRSLHERHCAVCHGIDGRGDTPAVRNQGSQPADHTDERAMAAFTDQQLAARIQRGLYQMPAFPEIRGDELVALVAFVRSQSMETVHAVELQQLAQGVVPHFERVTDEMLASPAPEDWLMYRRTYDSWAYSPLEQIDRDSVDRLELAWSWAMTSGRQYITPLAYRGVLYIESPRDILQALDAKTGDLIWEYRWQAPDETSAVTLGTHVRGTRS